MTNFRNKNLISDCYNAIKSFPEQRSGPVPNGTSGTRRPDQFDYEPEQLPDRSVAPEIPLCCTNDDWAVTCLGDWFVAADDAEAGTRRWR